MRFRRREGEPHVTYVYKRTCACGHSVVVSMEPITYEPHLPCCDKERPTSIRAKIEGE